MRPPHFFNSGTEEICADKAPNIAFTLRNCGWLYLDIHIYIENLEISQERLDGFSISLAQKKRNSMIQMSDEKNFEFRKIDKVMSDLVTKIGVKRLFLHVLS